MEAKKFPQLYLDHLRKLISNPKILRIYTHCTRNDWKRVIWFDESKIDLFDSDGKIYGLKRASDRLQTKHVKQTVKHGGCHLNILSCITFKGFGLMVHIEQNLVKKIIYKYNSKDHSKDSMKKKIPSKKR